MREFFRMIFVILAKVNKLLLPKYWHRDLKKLSKVQQLIIGYRIWVTKNSLK